MLLEWFLEAWKKRWVMLTEVGMSEVLWQTVREGTKRLREVGPLEWKHCLKLETHQGLSLVGRSEGTVTRALR